VPRPSSERIFRGAGWGETWRRRLATRWLSLRTSRRHLWSGADGCGQPHEGGGSISSLAKTETEKGKDLVEGSQVPSLMGMVTTVANTATERKIAGARTSQGARAVHLPDRPATSLQCWRRRGERPPKCRQQCRTQIKGQFKKMRGLLVKGEDRMMKQPATEKILPSMGVNDPQKGFLGIMFAILTILLKSLEVQENANRIFSFPNIVMMK